MTTTNTTYTRHAHYDLTRCLHLAISYFLFPSFVLTLMLSVRGSMLRQVARLKPFLIVYLLGFLFVCQQTFLGFVVCLKLTF